MWGQCSDGGSIQPGRGGGGGGGHCLVGNIA